MELKKKSKKVKKGQVDERATGPVVEERETTAEMDQPEQKVEMKWIFTHGPADGDGPFNPYKAPENKQVGCLVVLNDRGHDDPKRFAFPEGTQWKYQTIVDRVWLVVFHELAGKEIVDAQFPIEQVHPHGYVLGPTCLIRDKEW